MTNNDVPNYNESPFYVIEQIAKYLKEDYISKYSDVVTHDELRILDIVHRNPDICQRDLAKLALRDSVCICRNLDSLEKKELIYRFHDTKGKRLVKKMKLTQKGESLYADLLAKIVPDTKAILNATFSKEELESFTNMLRKLQEALSQSITLQV